MSQARDIREQTSHNRGSVGIFCQRKNLYPSRSILAMRHPVAARSVTTIIVLLISSPMVLQDVDIANDGGTGRYIYRTAQNRRRLQAGSAADKYLL